MAEFISVAPRLLINKKSGAFHLSAAQRKIIGEIQRLHARRAPLNISAVKRSHPQLIERVYKVRPFWGWKRALEDAGLSYTKINVALCDYVDCQICGRDFGAVVHHLLSDHNLTGEDYRRAYPGAEMICETLRAHHTVHCRQGKRTWNSLPRWEGIWTPEYVLDRMAELQRLKLPLNYQWVAEHEKSLTRRATQYFGSWDQALVRLGLNPARIRLADPTWHGRSPWVRADKAAIIAEIRRRTAGGEPISQRTILAVKHGSAFMERTRRLFGAWSNARVAAGLDSRAKTISPWVGANKSAILREICRRRDAREALDFKTVGSEKWGRPFQDRARKLFGSWKGALGAAGIVLRQAAGKRRTGGTLVDPRMNPWFYAGKAVILEELRRRERAGESLRPGKIAREKAGRAFHRQARALFGSWTAALLAAGVKLPPNTVSVWPKASKAEVLAEIHRRHRAGEPLAPKKVEDETWGVPLMSRAKILFGSWAAALTAAGLELPPRFRSPWPTASKRAVLAEIRRRDRAGKAFRCDAIMKEQWGAPLLRGARRLFGSWYAALTAAGIAPPQRLTSPWLKASHAEVLAEIQRRQREGKSLAGKDLGGERWGPAFLVRAKTLFGSWTGAILEAGVDPPAGVWSPWPQASKADVLAELRRRHRAGERLSSHEVHSEQWGNALLARINTLFGSWPAGLHAAGIERRRALARRAKATTPPRRSRPAKTRPARGTAEKVGSESA